VGGLYAAAGLVDARSAPEALKPMVEVALAWVLFSHAAGVPGRPGTGLGLVTGEERGRTPGGHVPAVERWAAGAKPVGAERVNPRSSMACS
jgi:hypothetical protein